MNSSPDTPLSADSPEIKERAPMNRALIGGIFLGLAVLYIALAFGLHRYENLIAAGKDLQTRYAKLDADFKFTPPAAGESPAPERVEKMLATRAAMLASLTPEAAAALAQIESSASASGLLVVAKTLGDEPALRKIAAAQADGMEQAEMSPAEYRWILGWLVREAAARPEMHPVGAQYNAAAKGLKLGSADALAAGDANGQADHPRPSAALVDRLASDRPEAPLLDLLTLAAGGGAGS